MTTYTQIISINGTALSEQPSSVNETPTSVYSDHTAISGAKERQMFGSKKRAVLGWEFATPDTARYFLALGQSGSAVSYNNSDSPFYDGANSFTGILTTNAEEYLRGGSGLSKLEVIIEEGVAYSA